MARTEHNRYGKINIVKKEVSCYIFDLDIKHFVFTLCLKIQINIYFKIKKSNVPLGFFSNLNISFF